MSFPSNHLPYRRGRGYGSCGIDRRPDGTRGRPTVLLPVPDRRRGATVLQVSARSSRAGFGEGLGKGVYPRQAILRSKTTVGGTR